MLQNQAVGLANLDAVYVWGWYKLPLLCRDGELRDIFHTFFLLMLELSCFWPHCKLTIIPMVNSFW